MIIAIWHAIIFHSTEATGMTRMWCGVWIVVALFDMGKLNYFSMNHKNTYIGNNFVFKPDYYVVMIGNDIPNHRFFVYTPIFLEFESHFWRVLEILGTGFILLLINGRTWSNWMRPSIDLIEWHCAQEAQSSSPEKFSSIMHHMATWWYWNFLDNLSMARMSSPSCIQNI